MFVLKALHTYTSILYYCLIIYLVRRKLVEVLLGITLS